MVKKTFWNETTLRKRVMPNVDGMPQFETVLARVEVEIDFDRIFQEMGRAALANKSGKSVEGGGLLVVKIAKERKL